MLQSRQQRKIIRSEIERAKLENRKQTKGSNENDKHVKARYNDSYTFVQSVGNIRLLLAKSIQEMHLSNIQIQTFMKFSEQSNCGS